MEAYLQRAQKIVDRIHQLASISEDEQGITRTFATRAFVEGRDKVRFWMEQAGLETRIDSIGNVRGRYASTTQNAKIFVIASHIDTVINAGKWDGPLGVILGLDVVEQIIHTKVDLPFHVELIAFSDEEGVRFHTTYLGSRVVAGSFDPALLQRKDDKGTTLQSAISEMGCNEDELQHDAIAKENWLGYLEIHIEQGPVLYENNIPVAIVTAIAGQHRIEITFTGMAGHAGTVPMNMRNDALCGAAEFILQVEKYASDKKNNMVATVGKLTVTNSASNVIAGEVICSLDVRSANNANLAEASQNLRQICDSICEQRNIKVQWNLIQKSEPVNCNEGLIELLSQSIIQQKYKPVLLVSGAGHDAVPIANVAPVAMLFVRCFKGISHNPLEDVELKDIEATVKISDNFIKNLFQNYPQINGNICSNKVSC